MTEDYRKLELEIYEWAVKNWKRLSKKAESFNKKNKPIPISVQLEKRFSIYPGAAARIARSVALWFQINKE